jgi:uncharacterized protein YqeY
MLDRIKDSITKATKNGNSIEKNILKLVLSDVQAQEARKNKQLSNQEIESIIKSFIKNNEETIKMSPTVDGKVTEKVMNLVLENSILKGWLPMEINKDAVYTFLESCELITEIKNFKSEGQAIGFVMSQLKKQGLTVSGDNVKEVISQIRT